MPDGQYRFKGLVTILCSSLRECKRGKTQIYTKPIYNLQCEYLNHKDII